MTTRLHPTDARAPQGDFISIAPAVCERLLGEPAGRSSREWRWGNKGSFRLKIDTGTWNDFEAGEGGGVLALVMREERLDKAGALAWLEQQGFLRRRTEVGTNAGYPPQSKPARSPDSAANQRDSSRTPVRGPKETLLWIRRQILPIADAPDHPIRAWMHRRNLWCDPSCPCRLLCAGSRRTHRSSGERTRALARSRFRLRRFRPGVKRIPPHQRPPRCSSSALMPKAREPTTRTPRGSAWTSRSSATPGLQSGPSGTCPGR